MELGTAVLFAVFLIETVCFLIVLHTLSRYPQCQTLYLHFAELRKSGTSRIVCSAYVLSTYLLYISTGTHIFQFSSLFHQVIEITSHAEFVQSNSQLNINDDNRCRRYTEGSIFFFKFNWCVYKCDKSSAELILNLFILRNFIQDCSIVVA